MKNYKKITKALYFCIIEKFWKRIFDLKILWRKGLLGNQEIPSQNTFGNEKNWFLLFFSSYLIIPAYSVKFIHSFKILRNNRKFHDFSAFLKHFQSAFNMQYPRFNTHLTSLIHQLTAFNLQLTVFNHQLAVFNCQLSAFNNQLPAFNYH